MLRDDNFGQLGFYSLGAHYCAFGIFSFAAAPSVNKIGPKVSMMIGCCLYALYIGAFILPCWCHEHPDSWLKDKHTMMSVILVVSAIATGYGGSVLWVA